MSFCSTKVVAERLGIHHFSVNRLIRDGTLPAFKIGRTYVVNETDLEELAKVYSPKPYRSRKIRGAITPKKGAKA